MEVKKLWVGAFGEVYVTTQVLEMWNNRAHQAHEDGLYYASKGANKVSQQQSSSK